MEDDAEPDLIGNESPDAQAKELFLESVRLVERLHRRMLDVVRSRLEEEGRSEINAVQALLLFNIGESETTAGELRSRGYYLGSNVSYNLKKLVEMGFLSHQPSEHDRRAVRISLTDAGMTIRNIVDDLFEKHLNELFDDEVFDSRLLSSLKRNLKNLEKFWSEQLRYH
jgi:DNA-binding MarR family transcriptional regulator